MSVWDSLVGQQRAVGQLRAVANGDPSGIAQSWLICGPPGSGRSNMARAFAAALESEDHGEGDQLTKTAQLVLNGTHPDVTVLATDKVTIGIREVRELVEQSEQAPATAPWRIIVIEDVDRMLERTTNVLLKEVEEPSPRTIWILCAPSPQDVLPTIRSRTRIVNLAVPSTRDVAGYLETQVGIESALAARAARLAEGHIGVAQLYAQDSQVLADRDELVVGVLGLSRASQAVLLAAALNDTAKSQAQADVERASEQRQREFRHMQGLDDDEPVPAKLRGAFNQLAKKDELKRQATRRTRDVLDRALNTIASVYRDVAVLQNGAEEEVGLVNRENRSAIAALSARLTRQAVVERQDAVETARRRLAGNGNPVLVFEALFCSLIA